MLGDDCNDSDITIHPAQVEICDGKNNDCDGAVDENTPQVVPWWPDNDGDHFGEQTPTFLATGMGAHGLYVSRDSKSLYIANRGEGSVSVLDFATKELVAKWVIPGGGSPDMGNVSADGKVLWLSGRYHNEVYAIDTTDGHLIARIAVGREPHGLVVWPQPGPYSLRQTGILR